MACKKDHSSVQDIMSKLPDDQGGRGRHKCAACAYKEGLRLGQQLDTDFDVGTIIDSLEESQAKEQRHKSPHAAFARGYYNGVCAAYGVPGID